MERSSLEAVLKLSNPPRHTVLTLCRGIGSIPRSLRGPIYTVLLGVDEETIRKSLTKTNTGDSNALPPGLDQKASPSSTLQPVTPQLPPSINLPPIPSSEDLSRLSVDDFDDDLSCSSSGTSSIPPTVTFPVPNYATVPSPLESNPPPLPNQRVVKADAERTRGGEALDESKSSQLCLRTRFAPPLSLLTLLSSPFAPRLQTPRP